MASRNEILKRKIYENLEKYYEDAKNEAFVRGDEIERVRFKRMQDSIKKFYSESESLETFENRLLRTGEKEIRNIIDSTENSFSYDDIEESVQEPKKSEKNLWKKIKKLPSSAKQGYSDGISKPFKGFHEGRKRMKEGAEARGDLFVKSAVLLLLLYVSWVFIGSPILGALIVLILAYRFIPPENDTWKIIFQFAMVGVIAFWGGWFPGKELIVLAALIFIFGEYMFGSTGVTIGVIFLIFLLIYQPSVYGNMVFGPWWPRVNAEIQPLMEPLNQVYIMIMGYVSEATLMITNPAKWYELQQAGGKYDSGELAAGVDIVNLETVRNQLWFTKDEGENSPKQAKVRLDIKNMANTKAYDVNVTMGFKVGDFLEIEDGSAKLIEMIPETAYEPFPSGRTQTFTAIYEFTNPFLANPTVHDEIRSAGGKQQFQKSYTIMSELLYRWHNNVTFNVWVASSEVEGRYVRNGNPPWKTVASVSSSGPVLLSLSTEEQPVRSGTKMSIYVALTNKNTGTMLPSSKPSVKGAGQRVELYIPEDMGKDSISYCDGEFDGDKLVFTFDESEMNMGPNEIVMKSCLFNTPNVSEKTFTFRAYADYYYYTSEELSFLVSKMGDYDTETISGSCTRGICDTETRQICLDSGVWSERSSEEYCDSCDHCDDALCNCDETHNSCPDDCDIGEQSEGPEEDESAQEDDEPEEEQQQDIYCSGEVRCDYGKRRICITSETVNNFWSDVDSDEYCMGCDPDNICGDSECNCDEDSDSCPDDCGSSEGGPMQ